MIKAWLSRYRVVRLGGERKPKAVSVKFARGWWSGKSID
jgi:hypothetical protein